MLSGQRVSAGFTAIELLVVLAAIGVLAAVALPGFQSQVRKARRADALAAVVQIQQAQERWRGRQPSYATSLSALGLPSLSPAGHYSLATATEEASAATTYSVTLAATGVQAQDAACRYLRVLAAAGGISQQSGTDTSYANDDGTNRTCWLQ